MKSSRTSALAACVGLCLATLALAQDRAPQAPPATRDTSLFASSVGLQYVDGQLWAGGRDFKVLFEADRFTYTPALGGEAPRNYPLAMRVEAYGRGTTRSGVGPAELSAEELTARYRRAEFTETYEVRPEGIKQSFVFDHLPAGTGDLVVRARIETDLQPSRTGQVEGSLSFSVADLGGVEIGAVVGVDAGGARVQGSMHYEEGVLEMRLPAAFIEQASLPLVLDPVIGPNIWVRVTTDENLDPDVAYDLTNDLYLVVFERRVSTGDHDIYGQRVNSDGTLNGGLLFIEPGAAFDDTDPAVANINSRDSFIVVYERTGNVIARAVNAATGARSSPLLVTLSTDLEIHPDVGGEVSNDPSLDDVLCVWENRTSNRIQVQQIQLNAAGFLSTAGTPLSYSGGSQALAHPAITKSGGWYGNYLLVFERHFSSQNTDILGWAIRRGNVSLTPVFAIAYTAADERLPDVDGDGKTNWVVAWQTQPSPTSGDFDIKARSVYVSLGGATRAYGAQVVIAGQAGVNEARAAVAWVSKGTCLIGWERQNGGPTYGDLYVRSVDLLNCLDCEGQSTLVAGIGSEVRLQMASEHSGGGTSEGALLVYQESSAVPPVYNGDIKARRWTTEDGIHTFLGGNCPLPPSRADNYAACARVGNQNFRVRVRAATPSTVAWLIVGLDRVDLVCGSCRLVPDPWTGFVVTGGGTNALGDAERHIPIPNASILAGMRFYTQWLLFGPTCSWLSSDMSNAQLVEIQ